MPSWTAVSRSQLSTARWLPRENFSFAERTQFATAVLQELDKLIPHFVLALVRHPEGFLPVVLLGLKQNQNLYVDSQKRWTAEYVPASLRGFPYALAEHQGEKILAIENSHISAEEQGEAFFSINGVLVESVAEYFRFLSKLEEAKEATHIAMQSLANAGLIKEWDLKIEDFEGNQSLTINGLFHIDEGCLQNLEADDLVELNKSGALRFAYAQIFSVNQTAQLKKRHELFGSPEEKAAPPSHQIFEDTGTIHFDSLL